MGVVWRVASHPGLVVSFGGVVSVMVICIDGCNFQLRAAAGILRPPPFGWGVGLASFLGAVIKDGALVPSRLDSQIERRG